MCVIDKRLSHESFIGVQRERLWVRKESFSNAHCKDTTDGACENFPAPGGKTVAGCKLNTIHHTMLKLTMCDAEHGSLRKRLRIVLFK